jgi:hypothetical protein
MQSQGTTRRYLPLLAVLATCCLGLFVCSHADKNGAAEPSPASASNLVGASSGVPAGKTDAPEPPAPPPAEQTGQIAADTKEAPKSLPPEIVKTWRDAGASVGRMKTLSPQRTSWGFWDPWSERGEAGTVPAFRFPERNARGVVAQLPDPGTPFGLDFHCGFYAGVRLNELAELKNLQSLNIGGVQGKAYADLTELAGLKQLRGLYLFHLPVTDAQLKHLTGLKSLQTLDLSSTRVTDAGLKELAGLDSLQALHLGCTKVTDAGLKELAGLCRLRYLDLTDTEVTDAGVAALQKELPACKIVR